MTLLRELGQEQAYLKAGIYGFAGGGKSWTASLFAVGLAQMLGVDRIAWFETENGSDYVKPRLFDPAGVKIMVAKSRAFQDLLTFVEEVEDGGIEIAVVDSLTHVWVELMAAYKEKKKVTRLEFQHFAEVKAEWSRFSEAFIGSRCHLIVCGRAGYEYDFFEEEQEGGGKPKKVLEKTGIKMKAEGEFSYEPSLVIRMEREKEFDEEDNKQRVRRIGHVEKDRFDVIDGKEFVNPSFKDILPHVQLLNIGGSHVTPDLSRNSMDLITDRDRSAAERGKRVKLALEEILATLTQAFPGTSGRDRQAKIDVAEKVFGVKSWAAVEQQPLDTLEHSLIPETAGGISRIEGACIAWKEAHPA